MFYDTATIFRITPSTGCCQALSQYALKSIGNSANVAVPGTCAAVTPSDNTRDDLQP